MGSNLAPEDFRQSDSIAEDLSSPLSSSPKTVSDLSQTPVAGLSQATTVSPSHTTTVATTPKKNVPASLEQSWALAIAEVCGEVNPHIVAAYIEPLSVDVAGSNSERFLVRGPSRLICNYVISNFSSALRERLAHFLDAPELVLSIIPREPTASANSDSPNSLRRPATPFIVKRVRPTPVGAAKNEPLTQTASTHQSPPEGEIFNNINPRYTFQDFVVGNSNQFCHAAAMRVAEKPGQSYNPLFS